MVTCYLTDLILRKILDNLSQVFIFDNNWNFPPNGHRLFERPLFFLVKSRQFVTGFHI